MAHQNLGVRPPTTVCAVGTIWARTRPTATHQHPRDHGFEHVWLADGNRRQRVVFGRLAAFRAEALPFQTYTGR